MYTLLYLQEKEMVAHSSILAWRIPGMEEPCGLPSMGLHRVTRLKWLSSSCTYNGNLLQDLQGTLLNVRGSLDGKGLRESGYIYMYGECLHCTPETVTTLPALCVCTVASVQSSSLLPRWTIAHQALLSMGFYRQECWSGLPWSIQGIFPTQGSNQCLLHCRWILYHWATRGKPVNRLYRNTK